ncbi:hypothetical protein K9F62_10175 [Desulfovibrio sp. JY]|nr:hypothetical protein K9F62_10175 [Desulfovibrio sp. JY]
MPKATSPAVRALLLSCLAAVFLLAFAGQVRTGATTSDDLVYEQHVITGSLIAFAGELAAGSGRFHHYLHVGLTSLPYHLDSEPARKAISLTVFAAAMASCAFLAATVAGLPALGLLAMLFATAFYQDNWHHNIVSSYPLVFDSGLLCITWAAYCLWRHGRMGRTRLLVLANLLAFAAYCHFEAFLCYAPLLCAVIWLAGERYGRPKRERLRTMVRANIDLAVYLVVYLTYRALHPSQYDGNALDLSSPLRILETVLAYSQSALPLGAFHLDVDYVNRFPVITSALVLDFAGYLRQLAGNWPRLAPAWLGLSVVTGGLAYHLLTRGPDRPRARLLPACLVLYAAYCPNFLISLSPKYQEPTTHGITWYVTSTFSAYAWAIALALAALWLCGRLSGRARQGLAAGLAVLAAAMALVNASVNASVLESKIAAASRWRMAQLAAKSPDFGALPDGATLIAPDLFTTVNVEITHPGYWEAWFSHHAGKRVHVLETVDPASPPDLPVYALRRLSAPTDAVTSILLARVTRLGPPGPDPYAPHPDQPGLLADAVHVVSDATNRYPDILYEDAGAWRLTPAMAMGRRKLSETTITGRAIPVASVAVVPSWRLAVAAPSDLTLRFGEGCSPPEHSISGPIVWVGDSGVLRLTNSRGKPVVARLTCNLVAMTPVRVRLTGPGLTQEIDATRLSTPVTLTLRLPPGESRLTLQTLPPTPGATKRLGLVGAALSPDTAAQAVPSPGPR